MDDREQQRRIKHRLSVLRHAEELSGNVAATCRYYGISRPTFYKWLRQLEEYGEEGLRDRSSRPRTCPHQTDAEVVSKIVYLRQHHRAQPMQRVVVGRAATRSRSISRPHATQTGRRCCSSCRRVMTSASESSRACRSSAVACARSYAIVAPSGSCSSSVEVSSVPSTMAATMRSSEAIWRAVRSCATLTIARTLWMSSTPTILSFAGS